MGHRIAPNLPQWQCNSRVFSPRSAGRAAHLKLPRVASNLRRERAPGSGESKRARDRRDGGGAAPLKNSVNDLLVAAGANFADRGVGILVVALLFGRLHDAIAAEGAQGAIGVATVVTTRVLVGPVVALLGAR